jgi:nucleotide-binding universal stress UspA family protein
LAAHSGRPVKPIDQDQCPALRRKAGWNAQAQGLRQFQGKTMINRIVCGVDGTDHSQVALLAAAELAAKFGADLTICLVNVVFGTSPRSPHVPTWTDAEAQQILDDASGFLASHGHGAAKAVALKNREASSGLIDFALANQIDHIVIGTGDKRGLSRLFLGSVAADVAARAPCTVIIAR